MKIKLTETRVSALMAARRGRLWPIGRTWRLRGARNQGYDERTIGPMVQAGLLADVHGTREITDAGRARLADLEGRR
jgi:hypothetical protein